MTCFAPAKINLALHVVGRRVDGYHLLDSLVAFATCGDCITVEVARTDTFEVTGPYAGDVPTDGSNLVLRARDLLRERVGDPAFPVRICLEKHLPVASGIGGGSSDAAATLKALRQLWNAALGDEAMAAMALRLGADVPMCLMAKPARIGGIGEQVEPVSDLPDLPVVLVNPGQAVATPDIFKRLRSRNNAPMPKLPSPADLNGWLDWLAAARNDLQEPAVEAVPVIADVLPALRDAGANLVRMSGSGATCFGLFSSAEAAAAAAAEIASRFPRWYVQEATLQGSEHRS